NKDVIDKLRERDLPREDREAAMKKLNEANQKALAGILKPAQEKRLKQIQRQQAGFMIFADPDVQKALDLKDGQKQKLKGPGERVQKEIGEIRENAGGDFQEAFRKMRALGKEKLDAAVKVLTDEQKKSYKEMVGEPFEIKFERPQ